MTSDKVIAFIQVGLSVLLILGYFFVFSVVIFGRATIPADQLRLADTLFGSLSTLVGLVVNYWFSRQRPTSPTGG